MPATKKGKRPKKPTGEFAKSQNAGVSKRGRPAKGAANGVVISADAGMLDGEVNGSVNGTFNGASGIVANRFANAVGSGGAQEGSNGKPTQKLILRLGNSTTRSGRVSKKVQDPDTITGEEYESAFQSSLATVRQSSPRYEPDNNQARPRRNAILNSHIPPISKHKWKPHMIVEEDEPEEPGQVNDYGRPAQYMYLNSDLPSSQIYETVPDSSDQPEPQSGKYDNTLDNVLDGFRSAYKIWIQLPKSTDLNDDSLEVPWTAKRLMQLYIVSYAEGEHNICDLIADTWIRALQKENHMSQGGMWKPNKSYNYKPWTSSIYSDVRDPDFADEITSFDQDLLNELYTLTKKDCGARLLWADAMALAGSNIESKLEMMEEQAGKTWKSSHGWHPDLVWNIMRTALRLARARLTLKLEEKSQDAWCRYHIHGKHRPCYRKVREAQDQQEKEQEDARAAQAARAAKSEQRRMDKQARNDSLIINGGYGDAMEMEREYQVGDEYILPGEEEYYESQHVRFAVDEENGEIWEAN